MPTILKCGGCGAILREWNELPFIDNVGYPRPYYYEQIYHEFNAKCPACSRELPKPTDFLNAMQIEVRPNPATLNKLPFVSAFRHDYHKEGKVGLPPADSSSFYTPEKAGPLEKDRKSARDHTSARHPTSKTKVNDP